MFSTHWDVITFKLLNNLFSRKQPQTDNYIVMYNHDTIKGTISQQTKMEKKSCLIAKPFWMGSGHLPHLYQRGLWGQKKQKKKKPTDKNKAIAQAFARMEKINHIKKCNWKWITWPSYWDEKDGVIISGWTSSTLNIKIKTSTQQPLLVLSKLLLC